MSIIVTLLLLFGDCVITNSQSSLQKWLDIRADVFSVPIKYMIHLEPEDPIFRKIKRSVTEDIKTEETFITNAEIIPDDKNFNRDKRTIDNNSSNRNKHGPNLNVKAGLRYHHQQRHPNGSISGSYATLDPKGRLEVMHYVSDEKGYREHPETGEAGSQVAAQNQYLQYQQALPPTGHSMPNIDIVSNGNVGHQAINLNQNINNNNNTKSLNNRRDINPIGNDHHHFVPNIMSPYNIPSPSNLGGMPPTPILNSAVNSVGQFGPRSPLFHKYYRPSPEEVQRTYEYHRLRSTQDPASFRPPEANNIPDVVRDKPMTLHGVYNEYQTPPYQVRVRDDTPSGYYVYNTPLEDTRHYNVPQYAPPLVPISAQAPIPPPQELYPRQPPPDVYPQQPPPEYFAPPLNQQMQQPYQPYPENVPAQPPLYFQSFDQQAFPPVQEAYPPGGQQAIPQLQDAFPPNQQGFPAPNPFNGPAPVPYVSSNANVNQPYPPNIPIYDAPAPQSIPVFSQAPPNNIPIYNQPIPPGPAPPAPAYIQPPPNNIPIYDQPLPPQQPQNIYYASSSTSQPMTTKNA